MSAPEQLSTPAKELSWDEAMKLAATDRDQLLERLHNQPARPLISQHYRYVGGLRLRRWAWWVENEAELQTLASGWALTEKAMARRLYRAYLRELNK